jgi:hypothetical protein
VAKLKKPTTAMIDRHLGFEKPRTKALMSEQIRALIRIYHISGIKSERAWDLLYDVLFLDPVTTRHFSQFQPMWEHRHDKASPNSEWWRAFKAYMGHMFDKTRDQLNNWRWDNPDAFGDVVDRSNPQFTKSKKIKRTGPRWNWYGTSDFAAKFEPPSCRDQEPGEFLASERRAWRDREHGIGKGYGPGNPSMRAAQTESPLPGGDPSASEGGPDDDAMSWSSDVPAPTHIPAMMGGALMTKRSLPMADADTQATLPPAKRRKSA